jgi:hypothetical protein
MAASRWREVASLRPAVEEIEALRFAQDDNICVRLALVEHMHGFHDGVTDNLQALGA